MAFTLPIPKTNTSMAGSLYAAWTLLAGSYADESTIRFAVQQRTKTPHIFQYELDWEQNVSQIVENMQQATALSISGEQREEVELSTEVLCEQQRIAPFHFVLLRQVEGVDGPVEEEDRYAVVVRWQTRGRELTVRVHVRTSLSDILPPTRLASQLERILAQITTKSAETRLADIQTASEDDINQIWAWNADVPERHLDCIHDVIYRRALLTPQACAVCAWDGDLTYAELDMFSTRLAIELFELGVTKGVAVPLCIEKSRWMPVAMLAVMKTGAACVALDVEWPVERLRAIVERIAPPLIVTSPAHRPLARELVGGKEVVEVGAKLEMDSSCQLPTVTPSDAAYITFTSGSTGVPKGAIISHSNVCSGIAIQAAKLGFNESSRVFDLAPYCFDLAWSNMLHTLCTGGCLCVPRLQDCQTDLSATIERFTANMMNITTSALRLVRPDTTGLHTILLCGEPADEDVVSTWAPRVKLFNTYGSAECPSKGAFALVERHKGKPPIGKGLATNTWIVNPRNGVGLCGIGMIGELWVEGPIVGMGYWADPVQTEKVFIVDPDWAVQGSSAHAGRQSRFYRTGDLVRYNSDGSLSFIGRKDQMVKIRGQRVELGEVEHCIRRNLQASLLHGITEVVVEVILPTGAQRPLLVAYIVVGEAAVDALRPVMEELEIQLTRTLPLYMVPSLYLPVHHLPRTATGKVDRRKIRTNGSSLTVVELSALDPRYEDSKQDPGTAMGKCLQELWSTVLNLDQCLIGAQDSFFRLGGDSITAIRLVGLAREKGLSLTVEDIFRYPDLETLAKFGVKYADEIVSEGDIAPFSLLPEDVSAMDIIQSCAVACDVGVELVEDILPCTSTQEAFMAVTAQKDTCSLIPYTFTLSSVESTKLSRALEEVITDNAILRTRIVDVKACGLVQVAIKEPFKLVITESISTCLEKLRAQSKGGLGERLSVFGLVIDKTTTSLVWMLHHAVYDGWSQSLILDQIQRAYHGYPKGEIRSIKTLLYYQKALDEQPAKQFWQSQLQHCQRPQFPFNSLNCRPVSNSSHHHEITHISWPDRVTAATVIQAAWAVTLSRYTGSDDVVFAATVSGRQAPIPAIEKIVAPTVATVPVRVKMEPRDSVQGLLNNVQQQAVEMAAFELTGLRDITRAIDQIDLPHIMETLLVIQPQDSLPGNLFQSVEHAEREELAVFNTFALMLETHNRGKENLSLCFRFDSTIVTEKQVGLLASQFETILRRIIRADPTDLIYQMSGTSTADLSLIWRWNARVPRPVGRVVHDLIEETVASLPPSKEAVCAWDGIFTYGQLQRYSNNLAVSLAQRDVRPEVPVVICLEKSKWMPVAMLGVMKAGGVAVALDVTQPMERLASIVRQVKPRAVVTSSASQSLARELFPQPPVLVENSILSPGTYIQSATVQASNRLFIVFTSGTTGTPKGVVITHSNFSSAIAYHLTKTRLDEQSRVFDFASHAFDGAWVNVLQTLHAGGCVCIPSEHERRNDLGGAIQRLQANFTYLPPSLLRYLDPSTVPSLKTVYMVGEAVPEDLRAKWAATCHVGVAYGPAECTVTSTMTDSENQSDIPHDIGVGVGVNTWVVDTRNPMMSLAPIGCVGELWLEGPLVGPGYLDNPAENARAFVHNPPWLLRGQGSRPGRSGRLYRTRDLVRYHSDGSLRFVGRKDTQVKLRGQRIELAEVEYHVRKEMDAYSAVRLAAEVIVPLDTTVSTLVVFVETTGPGTELLRALNCVGERLLDALPQYMVPAAYIPIDRLPLTATGKLDRRKLKHLGSQFSWKDLRGLSQSDQHQPNQRQSLSPVEETLQSVWSEVLNIPQQDISTGLSFTRHGGDSITAMQVVSRCRAHAMELTVGQLLSGRTIEQLAASSGTAALPQDTAEESSSAWGLSPVQQMYFEMYPDGLNHYNQAFLLRLRMHVEADELLSGLKQIVSRHGMLRARFNQRDGSWEQSIAEISEDVFRFTTHTASAEDLPTLASAEQETLDIRTGPVFAVSLISVENTQYILFTAHHLVVDLVSWRVIWHDLEQILRTGSMGPAPTTSFQTWCRLQREQTTWLRPEDVLPYACKRPDLEYWGLTMQENTDAGFIADERCINPTLTAALFQQHHPNVQIAPVDIILGALLYSFQTTFTDRSVPSVVFEGHGREPLLESDVNLSGTVGWFTTVHPLQVSMDAETSVVEVIRRVRLVRDGILGRGQPWFAHSYHSNAEFQAHQGVELLFNYVGAYQQLETEQGLFERGVQDEVPNQVAPHTKRVGLLETSARVHQGRLMFKLERHNKLGKQDQFTHWLDTFLTSLESAIYQLQNNNTILFDLHLHSLSPVEIFLAAHGLTVDAVEAAFPCTAIQKHMLNAQTNVGIYTVQLQLRVELHDGAASSMHHLQNAWDLVVNRYQALRTVFVRGSSSSQIILTPAAFRTCPSISERTHSLDIQSADSHLLVTLEMNHAVMDRVSMNHIMADWERTYYTQTPLPPLSTQLSDVLPEILRLERQNTPSLFFRRILQSTGDDLFTIPTNTDSAPQTHNARSYTRSFPQLRKLKSAAQTHNATPTSLFYAALASVLSTTLQRDHAGFATVSMARGQLSPSSQSVVGACLTLTPCIITAIPSCTPSELLQKTHAHISAASEQRVDIHSLTFNDTKPTSPLFNTVANYRKFERGVGESRFAEFASRDLWAFDFVWGVQETASEDELVVTLQWFEGRVMRDRAEGWMGALFERLEGFLGELV